MFIVFIHFNCFLKFFETFVYEGINDVINKKFVLTIAGADGTRVKNLISDIFQLKTKKKVW